MSLRNWYRGGLRVFAPLIAIVLSAGLTIGNIGTANAAEAKPYGVNVELGFQSEGSQTVPMFYVTSAYDDGSVKTVRVTVTLTGNNTWRYIAANFESKDNTDGELTRMVTVPNTLPGIKVGAASMENSATMGSLKDTGYDPSTACSPADSSSHYCLTAALADKPAQASAAVAQMPSSGDPAASWRQQAVLLSAIGLLTAAGIVAWHRRQVMI